ncbi:MAG: hypothetical protein JNK87_40285 [Bryobacterales bacterium]|nr:hypothetical protein [Bryobacterales bacterium]
MITSRWMLEDTKLQEAVARVAATLGPEVVRVRYAFGQDWAGAESLFFRVVVSDRASRRGVIGRVSEQVRQAIVSEVRPWEYGLQYYFDFRSDSECKELEDPDWD